MKNCLEEYRESDVNEIAEKYIEGVPQIATTAVNSDEGLDHDGEQIRGVKNEDSTIQEGIVTFDIQSARGEFITVAG